MQSWLLRNRPFLVFVPLIAVGAIWIFSLGGGQTPVFAGLWLAGLLLWTLLEWSLHRTMHLNTGISVIARIQDTAHLRHHREPDDLEHSVVRLSVSIPAAALLLSLAYLGMGDPPRAIAIIGGLLSGYLWYEFVHLTAHARRRWPGLRAVHRYHARHHYEQDDRCFGVTSPLWDWLFGTLPRRRQAEMVRDAQVHTE